MNLTARDIMRTSVHVVDPDLPLRDLDREFIDKKVSGFPVVLRDKLVGIVSRSDIVRQLYVEQSLAEMVSDYYREGQGFPDEPGLTARVVADQVGERFEQLRVKDVMIRELLTVSPQQSLRSVAQMLFGHHIHRVLVTEDERLVGIITAMDLVRLIAEGTLQPLAE